VLGVPDFDAVMPVLHAFQKDIDLTAFEFFGELAMQKVLDRGHVQRPFETQCPFYVLLEFEAPYEPIIDKAMEIFEHCMEQGWVLDGVIYQSLDQVEMLCRIRENISESIEQYKT
ncbi:FAD-linked oxidase C-terminal domain-containing protein, partial [Escherichia coli]|nr:FAD-linked oxidase C-terminal domain-containing protein [Escherichia coli]